MKPTILMADDDSAFALLVGHAVRKAQIQVELTAVRDGSDVVAYLSGEGRFANRVSFRYPDLVILDLHMPAMGGVAVLDWVRARTELRSLPIVMLSSSTELTDISQCYALGCRGYFVKPMTLPSLVQTVHQIVRYCALPSPATSNPGRLQSPLPVA